MMSNTNRISVVIPTFNRGKTILCCMNSILAQSYMPNEIIIVDDCSTDDTFEIVKCLGSPIVHYIRLQKNMGAQAARNRGILEAKGEWVAFQDSDDEWLPEKLEVQVESLRECGFDPMTVVHCDCWRNEAATGKKKLWPLPFVDGADTFKQLLASSGPLFPGILTSKLALEKIGLLDTRVPSYQEWDTAIRLAKYCRFIHIQKPLFVYHLHHGETISKNKKRDFEGYQYIVDKFRDDIVSICGRDVYNNHLTANALKAMNWGYFKEAGAILDKCMGSSQKILISKLLSRVRIRPSRLENFARRLKEAISAPSHAMRKMKPQ